MDILITRDQGIMRIALTGKFTYSDGQKFRNALDEIGPETQSLELDFANVEFIDSAGLGMLLVLRDMCHNKNISVTLRSVHGQVEKVFAISKFDQLFNLQR